MAERSDENSPDDVNLYKNLNTSESTEGDEMKPDLGVENIDAVDKKTYSNENHLATGSTETPKREENPFSFKHFLKRDSNSYHSQGARPKVYSAPHSSSLDTNHGENQPRIVPEFSSALPDFVQDHLVIEQCYLGNNDTSPQEISVALDNLPDFTPSRNGLNRWTDTRSGERRSTATPSNLPLDLPGIPNVGFPLDLPLTETQSSGTRSCPQSAEVGVSKSLPDFLSDGAVYSQPEENNSIGQSPERESDRLRRELELCRRQLTEQTRRVEHLQRQLEASRNKEHEYTHNLTKAMEQIEENLNISNRRANNAENTLAKLRQDIKQLNVEVMHLQKENRSLRGEEGATGGVGYVPNLDVQTQRFAQELRSAAGTAEMSLRQLLNGVDNLRMMAAAMENIHRIEERTDTHFRDLDDDPDPAL